MLLLCAQGRRERGGQGHARGCLQTRSRKQSGKTQGQSIPVAVTYGTCFFQGHGAADLRGLSPPNLTPWTGSVSQRPSIYPAFPSVTTLNLLQGEFLPAPLWHLGVTGITVAIFLARVTHQPSSPATVLSAAGRQDGKSTNAHCPPPPPKKTTPLVHFLDAA